MCSAVDADVAVDVWCSELVIDIDMTGEDDDDDDDEQHEGGEGGSTGTGGAEEDKGL